MLKLIYRSWAGTEHLLEVTEEQAKHLLQSGYHSLAEAVEGDAAPAPPPFPEPAPADKATRATES